MDLKNKTFLNVSYWGWPLFGGGEQFLYDCMKWVHNAGMNAYWICFANSNPHKKTDFDKFNVVNTEYGVIMQIPGGYSEKKLQNWVKLIKPDIINHQGRERLSMVKACFEIGYPIMTGVCFWNECIELNERTFNRDIMLNIKTHKEHSHFREILKCSSIVYTASYFVTDVIQSITGIRLPHVIYSSSNKDNCKLNIHEQKEQKYVTLINYHELKGGKILLECIKKLPHIPFLCVKTEHMSEGLDKQIENAIDARNAKAGTAKSKYIKRVDRIKDVLCQTKILLVTSLVDETFCRTCNEALCNGIPVLTTGKGNIAYMVGDAAAIINETDYDGWANEIEKLYSDEVFYDIMSKKTLKQYEQSSEEIAEKQLLDAVYECIFKKRKVADKNIMLFVPWCDQGLGIQGRNYVSILKEIGYETFIFSFKPYLATEKNPRFQKNPKEWIHPNVYYSQNDRESVTDDELISFVQHNNISKMILPETCFDRVFEIAELLNKYDVKTYCVPNIEIVRSNELHRYNVFEGVLCNNHYCEDLLNKNGILNTSYVSHITLDKRLKFKKKVYKKGDRLKFLNIGGLNAIVRKQCFKVCKAFADACKIQNNMEMMITIQGSQVPTEILQFSTHPNIKINISHLQYRDIVKLYHNSHVSIQVSKHEGLGLGFYESLISGTPVITLNTPLHNEIILDGVNGWHVPCDYEEMKDNPFSLLKSAIFDSKDLTKKMLEIYDNYDDTLRIIKNTKKNHDERFNLKKVSNLFYEAMNK
jgi:glycosyltransferase involved in cell wall biosynthesis